MWPVYLVTLHLAAAWIIFTLYVGHEPSKVADQLNAVSYVRQLLLVQLWFQPFFDGSSWDGPAWSISAEWLAYLLFGLLVLVVFRIARATRARGLLWLAFAASLPPTLLLLATGQFYTPWSWLPRIVMQFTAGALACAAVRKLQLSDRARRGAGYLSVVLGVAIVGILYLLDAHPMAKVYDSSGLVDVLFVPLVVTLAVGAGTSAAAAVHPSNGVLRAHLVQPVHGARIGAYGLELGHSTVRDRPDARLVGQANSGGRAGGRPRRCGTAVPLRRGARPPLDAQNGQGSRNTSRVPGHPPKRPTRRTPGSSRFTADDKYRPNAVAARAG